MIALFYDMVKKKFLDSSEYALHGQNDEDNKKGYFFSIFILISLFFHRHELEKPTNNHEKICEFLII